MTEFKTIVLTTDFSPTSRQAFPAALAVAEKFGSRIFLVYVDEERLPPFIGDFPGIDGFSTVEILENHKRMAAAELERVARSELAGAAEVEPVMLAGTPHREIVEFAGSRGADLIVMATHGRGFITHALMGSTTERVLRNAPCPVLAVRETRPKS
jgi:nucleotide-binding universal stress UspA family protein